MSYKNLDNKKRLVKSRSGLRIVSIDDERTSPFELQEPAWVPDKESDSCTKCQTRFDFLTRKHHCRRCGNIFCSRCCESKLPLRRMNFVDPVRVCVECVDETRRENDFYDKHLRVLTDGANFTLDETGSGISIPILCCLSKDQQNIILDGGNMWQHNPINLVDIMSVRVIGAPAHSGVSHVSGAVLHFRDFKGDDAELRVAVADIPNRKQAVAWIAALNKAVKLLSSEPHSP